MVNNTDIHIDSTRRRRFVPGRDYLALALLGAPLASSVLALLLFDVLDVNDHVWIGIVACAVLGALVGWCAPSVRRLAPGVRACWVAVSGLLSVAVPVVAMAGLLYAACYHGCALG